MHKLSSTANYRVKCKGSRSILGWADPKSIRDVHGIVVRDKPIRREVFVIWDHTYPPGFINMKDIDNV
jgi:hypothetical protein